MVTLRARNVTLSRVNVMENHMFIVTHSVVRIWKILFVPPKVFANNLTVVILGLVYLIL